MRKVPNTKKIEAYGKRTFHTKRLRKKQIATLRKAYAKLSKRHNAWVANITTTKGISEREGWLFMISVLRNGIDTINKCKDIPVCEPIISEEEQDKIDRKELKMIEQIKKDPVGEYVKRRMEEGGLTEEQAKQELEERKEEFKKMLDDKGNS